MVDGGRGWSNTALVSVCDGLREVVRERRGMGVEKARERDMMEKCAEVGGGGGDERRVS